MTRFLAGRRAFRGVLAAFALALGPIPATGPAAAFSIEMAEFVVSVTDGRGNLRSVVADVVPYLPERACFGWRIRLAGAPALVKYREVLQLPGTA